MAVAGRKVLSSSALLTTTVNPQGDFGVYAYPYSITVVAGFTNSTSIILYGKNGFNGSVTLSATVPFGFVGVMGGQNPVKLTSGATSIRAYQYQLPRLQYLANTIAPLQDQAQQPATR